MAGILIIGAIPSGLAGTISSANGLYVVRFFIGLPLPPALRFHPG